MRRAIWDARGTTLLAIDYSDLDGSLRHVRFESAQVTMFTPEEIIGAPGDGGAADLGQSAWFHSFRGQHVASCRHFQLLFYDELLDIIDSGHLEITYQRYPQSSSPLRARCEDSPSDVVVTCVEAQ